MPEIEYIFVSDFITTKELIIDREEKLQNMST